MRPNRRAFSLVGFLVAASLFSIILIPLFMLFQSSRQTTSNSIHFITASQLIGTQIEKLKALPFRKLERYIVNPTRPEQGEGDSNLPDIVNGPFERDPEVPDIVEENLLTVAGVSFERLTYIAYFPDGNPDPSSPDFLKERQRIRIRVLVRWRERGAGNVEQQRKLAISTIVHNEGYHPKPLLDQRYAR